MTPTAVKAKCSVCGKLTKIDLAGRVCKHGYKRGSMKVKTPTGSAIVCGNFPCRGSCHFPTDES